MEPVAVVLLLALVFVVAALIVTFEDQLTERRAAARVRAAVRRIGEDR